MKKEVEIKLPKLGESIVSAIIVTWLKKEGDQVRKDEPLLEVTTDKMNTEIPSSETGVLKKILAHPDEEKQVGDVLAIIEISEKTTETKSSKEDFYSPVVLRLAKENNISLEDLPSIPKKGDRLSKKDIEAYLDRKTEEPSSERIKMSPMRKMISHTMQKANREVPQASIIQKIDMTNILQLIEKEKEYFLNTHQVKLTVTSFVIEAISFAIQQFPLVNTVVDEDDIILKKDINVGVAVNIKDGLVVPVIHQCNKLSLLEIAKKLSELSHAARAEQLTSEQIQKGTITLTNFGMTGIAIGMPIIRYPEVSIVGIGAIKKELAVINDHHEVRSMCQCTFTFDHRVFDGMYACGFLRTVQDYLENKTGV